MSLFPVSDLIVTDGTSRSLRVKGEISGTALALRNSIATGAKTVTGTAAEVFAGSSRLSGRYAMIITNTGSDHIYIGNNSVTVANGFPLFPQDSIRIEFDPSSSVGIFALTNGANVEVRVVELS